MDINEMNDGMDKLSVQFKQMVTKIGELREQINAVLEENSELKIENEHLRELLENSGKKMKEFRNFRNLRNFWKSYIIRDFMYATNRMGNDGCKMKVVFFVLKLSMEKGK
ncbi:initiation control protein YabA [Fructilactobacillus sanfranciscensis]